MGYPCCSRDIAAAAAAGIQLLQLGLAAAAGISSSCRYAAAATAATPRVLLLQRFPCYYHDIISLIGQWNMIFKLTLGQRLFQYMPLSLNNLSKRMYFVRVHSNERMSELWNGGVTQCWGTCLMVNQCGIDWGIIPSSLSLSLSLSSLLSPLTPLLSLLSLLSPLLQ